MFTHKKIFCLVFVGLLIFGIYETGFGVSSFNEWFIKGLFVTDVDKKIKYFTKAIEIYPKYEYAYFNRGIAYVEKGLYDEAIRDYTKAIQINPKFAGAYSSRGIAYVEKGLNDEAIQDCTKAIQINPKLADAYFYRGVVYALKELKELSISDLKRAADLGSEKARQLLKEFFNIDY